MTGTKKYFDVFEVNIVHGRTVSQWLPFHEFKWLTDKEIPSESNFGNVWEVVSEYPKELHGWITQQLSTFTRTICVTDNMSTKQKNKATKTTHFLVHILLFFLAWGTIAFLAKASKSYQKEWLQNLRAIKISTFTKIAWLYLTTWLQFKEKMFGSQ